MQLPHCGSGRTRPGVLALLLAVTALTSGSSNAGAQQSRETEFRAFYDQFLAAVRANDRNKVADLINFPATDWSVEQKGNVQTIGIANRAEFLAKYELFFTPSMRAHALKSKPQKISDNHYAVIWQNADAEFSFEFEYASPHGFRLTSFLIGAR
jgi:hypothetical protein